MANNAILYYWSDPFSWATSANIFSLPIVSLEIWRESETRVTGSSAWEGEGRLKLVVGIRRWGCCYVRPITTSDFAADIA